MPLPTHADLVALAALSADVAERDGRIATAQSQLAELRGRRGTVRSKLDRHERARPSEAFTPDAALTEAMAANPAGTIDAATRKKVQEQQVRHVDKWSGWNADGALLTSAGAQLDGEIADAEAALEAERSARGTAWAEFSRASHVYLIEQFRASWAVLRTNVIEPLMAMDSAIRPELRIVKDTFFIAKGSSMDDSFGRVDLFPINATRSDRESHVARFRQGLAEGREVLIVSGTTLDEKWPAPPRSGVQVQRNGNGAGQSHREREERAHRAGRDAPRDAYGWPIERER